MTKKVIIIDDSVTQLNFLKTYFAKNDWEIRSVQNANDAYEMIYDFAPDIIITDAIMPAIGGFQLAKMIREDEKISKIPVIVYSVLDKQNAKFYIKEEKNEYFLKKNNNSQELMELARKLIEKHPVNESYKSEILKIGLARNLANYEKKQTTQQDVQDNFAEETTMQESVKLPNFNFEELEYKFKERYDFSYSDDKIISDICSILYPILDYDLCTVCVNNFENNNKKTYFDIKNIILSPIFQNKILNKYNSKDSTLFKKYAPNLKMIINEEEFYANLEFNFTYEKKETAQIAFYSQQKDKWGNYDNIENLRKILKNFFKARYINKSSIKKEGFSLYNFGKTEFNFLNKFDYSKNLYFGILQIINFDEIKENLSYEELDILNTRISEKIIGFIEKNEQIYKHSEDEYRIVIFAKDDKQALYRFNCIANIINGIFWENQKLEAAIGVNNCRIEENFNFQNAQKMAREALEEAIIQEKVVIK